MEGLGETIAALVDGVERIGIANIVLLFLSGAAAVYFIRNKPQKSDTPVKDTVAGAVTPLTCAFGELSRYQIDELVRDMEKVKDDVRAIRTDLK